MHLVRLSMPSFGQLLKALYAVIIAFEFIFPVSLFIARQLWRSCRKQNYAFIGKYLGRVEQQIHCIITSYSSPTSSPLP